MALRQFTLAILLLGLTVAASAREGAGIVGGVSSGFMHPLLGWDHVPRWWRWACGGAILGYPALWLLPVVFPLVMAVGGALGVFGMPLPGVEIGIAASALVLGSMVLLAARPPLGAAVVLVGIFAIFHGHAHGTELPDAANPLAYALGFVSATGMLHLSGITFGLFTRWPSGKALVRAGGVVIALAGAVFLVRAV